MLLGLVQGGGGTQAGATFAAGYMAIWLIYSKSRQQQLMIGESWRRPRYPTAVAGGAAPRMMGLRSHPHTSRAAASWSEHRLARRVRQHLLSCEGVKQGRGWCVCVGGWGREELAIVTVVESRS